MELILKARKTGKKLSLLYPDQAAYDIKRLFKDGILEVVVREPKTHRSDQQNRYYWGVLVPMIRDGLREMGSSYSRQEVHDALKAKFLSEDVVVNGEKIIEGIHSTTGLSKDEMNEYMDSCRSWAFEWLNIAIPLPGEQTEIFLK